MFNRAWWAKREELKARFRPYIRPGDLVFDIGANRGEYANDFYEMGGRVVAVEPNPRLITEIERHYGRRLHDVVCAAVGDKPGVAILHVAGDDQHSTLNERWRAISPERDWRETLQVKVVTLDHLIGRYGQPDFVKIDVEGYEPAVLRGLSYPLRALCFEWQAALPGNYAACVERLAELGTYEVESPDPGRESADVLAVLR